MTTAVPMQYRTPEEAAELLKVKPSWLRKRASNGLIPCHYVGRYLRFTDADIKAIQDEGAFTPVARTTYRRK